MITIKNHDYWIDFVFSIKGNLYQCKHTEEIDDWYTFRFENIGGWNYPQFEVSIGRDRVSEDPMIYRIHSQRLNGPGIHGASSYNLLTKDELRNKDVIEQKMLWVLENSCG